MKLHCLAMGATVLAMTACEATTEGIVVANQPPSISFTFEKLAIRKGLNQDLTVSISDPNEDDVLSVTWEVSRGTLTPRNSSNTVMEWETPKTTGTDTLWITVSDGKASTTIVEEIKVGTQAPTLRALYTADQSPYIVSPDPGNPKLSIPEGFTAVVDSGVELLIDEPFTEIIVEGNLEINGTELNPVVIKPNRRFPFVTCGGDPSWWTGIRVSKDGTALVAGILTMSNAVVRNAEYGVRLTETGSATITSSALQCTKIAGVRITGSGSLVVTDCDIDNNTGNGVDVRTGLTLTPPASVSITDCRIRINRGVGIEIDIDDQNGSVPIMILRNEIVSNLTYGIRMSTATRPVINFNSFFANGTPPGEYNIYLTKEFPLGNNIPTIDATENYWGAAYSTQAPIDATVWDSLDSPSVLTRLTLSPWRSMWP